MSSNPAVIVALHDVIFVELMRIFHDQKHKAVSSEVLQGRKSVFCASTLVTVCMGRAAISDMLATEDVVLAPESESMQLLKNIKTLCTTELTTQDKSDLPDQEIQINESYMCLPATPSKNIPDKFFDHRNVVIVQPTVNNSDTAETFGSRRVVVESTNERRISVTTDTPTLQLPSSFPFLRSTNDPMTSSTAPVVSGHTLLKAIGFQEVLYTASFDKRPSCQPLVSVVIPCSQV